MSAAGFSLPNGWLYEGSQWMYLPPYQHPLQIARVTARLMWRLYEAHLAEYESACKADLSEHGMVLLRTFADLEACVMNMELNQARLKQHHIGLP